MLKLLKAPFPSGVDNTKEKVISALLCGMFVALFLLIFQPFGVGEENIDSGYYFKFIGFGIVSFLGVFIVDFGLPKIMPRFFDERQYTVLRELILGAIIILVIGIGNTLYLNFFYKMDLGWEGFSILIGQTFLIGIFPFTLLTLYKLIKLQKDNLRVSQEINLGSDSLDTFNLNSSVPTPIIETEVNLKVENLDLFGLLYVESVGNYINLTKTIEGELTSNLYRKTLKSIAEDNLAPHIIRCHRSYIVNLEKVSHVTGNAQGLKLSLYGCEEKIPVSRKYIPKVKNLLTNKLAVKK